MQFIQVPRSIFDECVELLKISGVEVMVVAVEALGRERTPTQPIHERDALHGIIAARLPGWMEGAGSGIGGWNLAPTPSYNILLVRFVLLGRLVVVILPASS